MNSEIAKIKNADRRPVECIDDIIVKLNNAATQNHTRSNNICWTLANDSVGPCLHAVIKFTNPIDCLKFVQYLYELQEAADHHSNFMMDNFHTINLMLSTHHPVPAITYVDVLFAEHLTCH